MPKNAGAMRFSRQTSHLRQLLKTALSSKTYTNVSDTMSRIATTCPYLAQRKQFTSPYNGMIFKDFAERNGKK
ncbi:hypothetical protein [Sansalvadorimonas verongulae]|uniref:hypothetical protein n=1 Tax=Sansalvadorimonas verongulae TaxID=2172824 RepID=UPI0012BB80E4|nr:hypothetical protein [Sansalvadorimonas verongulae]MTI14492.1 hypothetical protein [Sansalvadorimonas verongulae]